MQVVIVRSGQFFILGAILLSVLFFLGLTLTNTLLTSPKKDISFLSENYKRDLPRAFNLGVLQGQSGRSLGNFTNFTDSVLTQNFINFTAFFVVSEPADNDTVDITIGNFLDSPLSVDIKLDNSGTLGAVGSGNVQSVPGGRRLYLQGEEEPLPLPSPGPGCPSGGRDTLIDSSPQTTCNAGMPPGQTCMVSFNYSDSNDCPAQARVGLGISYDTSPGNEAMLRKANINTSCSPGKVMKIVSTILGCTDGWNCVQYLNGQAGVQDSGNPTPDFANITWILEACPGFGGSYDVANKGVAELGSQINFNDFVSFQLPPPPNSPPDVTGVSTSPDADGNLTCSYSGTSDADGDAVFAHYSWLRDGSPAQALNMPFDTELDGRTYDYSGNNLTGNLTGPSAGGGPNWTASGLAGGAMQFDGTDDKVKISQPLQALTGNNFTIEAWVNMRIWGCDNPEYPVSFPGECPVFTQYSYPTGYYFYVYNGRPSLFASFTEAISPDTITTNEWHHLAGVANTTHLLIYVDGVLKASSPFSGVGSSSDAYIGGDGSVLTDFNGTIDEVIVWNSALPAGQIQLHAARIYNKLASAAQSIGGAWTCSVTPIDEDGINGTTAASQVSPQECGNGVVEPPEQCEPPGTSSCSQSCNMLALPVYLNPGAIPPGETRTINSGAPVPDQFNITINWSGESRTFTWWKDKASLFSAYTLRRGDDVAREELVS